MPDRRRVALVGAALGASSGPVAAFGQGWAGTGDGRAHIWVLATLCGALLGALTYPVFLARPTVAGDGLGDGRGDGGVSDERVARWHDLYGVGFAALFGFAVGIVSGAFVAFPMGSVVGGFGGAVAAAITAFATRRLPIRGGLAIGWALGAGLALLLTWLWLS